MANYKPLTAVIETVQQSQAETNGKDCPPQSQKVLCVASPTVNQSPKFTSCGPAVVYTHGAVAAYCNDHNNNS